MVLTGLAVVVMVVVVMEEGNGKNLGVAWDMP
jgi:hypothetical protein